MYLKIPIVLSTDHTYVVPTGVTIHSFLSSGEFYDIYVICDNDVTERDRELLSTEVVSKSKLSTITFLNLGEFFNDSYIDRHLTKASYGRLLIPWLLPQYDKIIYCDSDMIFNIRLGELFIDINLDDYYCAGVKILFEENTTFYSYVRNLKLNPLNYINAGFLILNCKKLREDQLKDKLIDLSKKSFKYHDQDIINIVFKNKIKLLDQKYNVPDYRMSPEWLSKNYIIHYVGRKPWAYLKKCWLEWWLVYRETSFFDYQFYFNSTQKIIFNSKEVNKAQPLLYLIFAKIMSLTKKAKNYILHARI